MSPDDPRHGTHAGALAHWRQGVEMCAPCRTAARRYRKRNQMLRNNGVEGRVQLGDRAWQILTDSGCTQVAKLTGLGRNNLYRMQRVGPTARVQRSTRSKIVALAPPTSIGIQRRLQALAVIGHTTVTIGAIAGLHPEPLGRLRRRATPPIVVKSHMAAGVVRAYNELAMRPAPSNRNSNKCRTVAVRNGWVAPLAWDDIDRDAAPYFDAFEGRRNPDDIEPIVVDRLVLGHRVESTRAEKEEAMRRWLADGKTQRELCLIHGWREGRYVTASRGAA